MSLFLISLITRSRFLPTGLFKLADCRPSVFVQHTFASLGYVSGCVKDSVRGITAWPAMELTQNRSSNRGLIKKNQRELYRGKNL